MIPDQQVEVRIDVFGEVSEAEERLFSNLVQELLPLASIPDPRHLKGVFVVPRNRIELTVNELLGDGDYVAGPYPPPATAVPVERSKTLACFVVLSLEEVAQLRSGRERPNALVRSLLEELLHIRIYVTAWQKRGWVYPPHLEGRDRDVFVLCSNCHDEYFVNREKAAISATQAIYDHPDMLGMRTPLVLAYGGQLSASLESAGEELAVLSRLDAGPAASEELWRALTTVLYRQILEPLARDAGYRAGTPEPYFLQPNKALGVPFYHEHVAPYWDSILACLEHSYQTGLRDMDKTIDDMFRILQEFIAGLETIATE